MTLENLRKTRQLKEHRPVPAEIRLLLDAARRNLKDSEATNISAENRFDASYKCLMQAALVALMANGYMPDRKTPGHHAVTLQTLPKTIEIEPDRIVVLDALRNKRNLSDYTGKEIDEASVETCRAEAAKLLADVSVWLERNRPDLLR